MTWQGKLQVTGAPGAALSSLLCSLSCSSTGVFANAWTDRQLSPECLHLQTLSQKLFPHTATSPTLATVQVTVQAAYSPWGPSLTNDLPFQTLNPPRPLSALLLHTLTYYMFYLSHGLSAFFSERELDKERNFILFTNCCSHRTWNSTLPTAGT